MGQVKSIKGKILVYFCLTVGLTMLVIGGITNWRLDLSIDKQSEMLSKDVVSNTYETLKGHHEILKTFNENIRESSFSSAKELSNNPVLKTIIDNEMYDSLGEFLAAQFQAAEVDFAMIFSIEGKLLASFPSDIDKTAAEQVFNKSYVGREVKKALSQGGDSIKGVSGVSLFSSNFLEGSTLAGRTLADRGGISVTGAMPVMDSFGSPVALSFTGTILNGHNKFLKQLYYATGSSCSLYMNNLPLAFAGYGENTSQFSTNDIRLSSEATNKIYASEESINDIIELAGEPHLATCSPIISSENEKVGSQCVTYPESKLIKAAEYGSETKRDLQFWFISLGILSMCFFVAVSVLIAKSIAQPLMRSISQLNQSAQLVAQAGNEIYSASNTLSDGATDQAASLEQTSASLEEMASMTRQNAENSTQANGLMNEVSTVISSANTSMRDLIHAMEEISTASQETSKIIKTIDEIAFQTNLLALNAAVEAARAGEAGAGFAVVADEVRNLAMRAAQAAKDTGDLIEGTVSKVQEGDLIVRKTAKDFAEAATQAANTTSLVGEITGASQDQAQGIQQLNISVSNIDKITQGNSAQAEHTSSAASDLNEQAGRLKEVSRELTILVVGKEEINDSFDQEHPHDRQETEQFLLEESDS